jgi:hypothetical protein
MRPDMAEHDQRFDTYAQWVDKAPSWLGQRGPHEKAICLDSRNRLCAIAPDFARARDEEAFPVRWLWPEDVATLAVALASECCVPRQGEPSFVLLGRDPQAPDLVERWAADREITDPSGPKPAMAREVAARMRSYRSGLAGTVPSAGPGR